jgi:hypothetical protein
MATGTRLSSDVLYGLELLGPMLWIAGFGWATIRMFLGPEAHGVPVASKLLGLAFVAAGVWRLVWKARRLKRVHIDGDALIISDYFSSTRVPLSSIVDVRQRVWFDRMVTIELADPNPFNGVVRFLPSGPSRMLFWRDDEVVTDLRRRSGLDALGPGPRAA